MADINSSDLVGGGSKVLPQLAPDIGGLVSRSSTQLTYAAVTNIDGSSGFATALSLTGKYAISTLWFTNCASESMTVKVTCDGDIIYNDTLNVTGGIINIFSTSSTVYNNEAVYMCESSFLVEISTTTDNNVALVYTVRAIK